MIFEQLNPKKHDRKCFDCGVPALNLYLQHSANQDQRRHLTKVYVLADGERIIGYYSISAHSVPRDDLPKDIKLGGYKDVPFILLGRLAVDKDFQGRGYGDALILHAFDNVRDAAQKVGILGVIVDAKDDQVAGFYQGFGFRQLSVSKNRLVLPFSAIDKLLSS